MEEVKKKRGRPPKLKSAQAIEDEVFQRAAQASAAFLEEVIKGTEQGSGPELKLRLEAVKIVFERYFGRGRPKLEEEGDNVIRIIMDEELKKYAK